MNILISIIIPVYNDQNGINCCLDFISKQNLEFKYEAIVIDNLSDKKIVIEKKYSHFAKVVTCDKRGAYAARNTGINTAQGDLLVFTDADCTPHKDWLKNGSDLIIKENGKFVIGGEVLIKLPKKPSAVAYYQYIVGFMQKENIEKRNFSATANLFATKEQFRKVGMFNEQLLSGGDREWCWRAIDCGFPIKYADETIVETLPRNSLRDAIRQTRRIAGGRFFLRQQKNKIPYISKGICRHLSPWESFFWLTNHPDLSRWNRVKVLGVAIILKLTHTFEMLRLSFFESPERG